MSGQEIIFLVCDIQCEKLTTISDKLRSKLYKIYKKKTGLDPWIKSENLEPPQIEKTDNCILQDRQFAGNPGKGTAIPNFCSTKQSRRKATTRY